MASNNHPNAGIQPLILTQRDGSTSDPCIYIGGDMYIGVYIDDIILVGRNEDKIKDQVKMQSLTSRIWESYTGMTVLQDEVKDWLTSSHRKFPEEIWHAGL